MLPIRDFISGGRVFTGAFVLGTINEPATSNQVLSSFLGLASRYAGFADEQIHFGEINCD